MIEILPYQGYKDELDTAAREAWAEANPALCVGWFTLAQHVANGAGECVRCRMSVRVDVNGEPVKHTKAAYLTSSQRGGARERVPL